MWTKPCRFLKKVLNGERHTKGAESQVMCFEYQDGFESRSLSSPTADENDMIPKRPRSCTIEETANDDNDCICYIIQASGQSGPKQTLDGAGFRPEIDYIEIRRADGTYGSERSKYAAEIKEFCPDAETTFPTVDEPITIDDESPVKDPTQCTKQCGGAGEPACNRVWKKTNLRRRWHEAGRIKNGRMGSLSGVLKGELLLWGGECYGDSTVRDFGPDGFVRAVSNVMKPRPCRMTIDKSGKRRSGDYIEAFSFVRMNKAGFIFGERRQIDLVGFPTGSASHDESATSQAFSVFNTMH